MEIAPTSYVITNTRWMPNNPQTSKTENPPAYKASTRSSCVSLISTFSHCQTFLPKTQNGRSTFTRLSKCSAITYVSSTNFLVEHLQWEMLSTHQREQRGRPTWERARWWRLLRRNSWWRALVLNLTFDLLRFRRNVEEIKKRHTFSSEGNGHWGLYGTRWSWQVHVIWPLKDCMTAQTWELANFDPNIIRSHFSPSNPTYSNPQKYFKVEADAKTQMLTSLRRNIPLNSLHHKRHK